MPALKAIITGDSSQLMREFVQIQRVSSQTASTMQRNMDGVHSTGRSSSIRETLVLMREMSRGNWTRVPGSLSLLLTQLGVLKLLFKDNAAAAGVTAQAFAKKAAASSLAAKAAQELVENDAKVMSSVARVSDEMWVAYNSDKAAAAAALEKAAADRTQAAAAFQSAEALQAEGVAARFSISPIGWVAIGLIAVGTAAYMLVRHFRALEERERNLNDLMDLSIHKFSDQADAMKSAAERAQAFKDWLDGLAESQSNLTEKTNETIKAMREEAKFQREAAENRGASRAQLLKMDIDAASKEYRVLLAAQETARRKLEDDKKAARDAESNANNPQNDLNLKTAKEHASTAAQVANAIQEKMRTELINVVGGYRTPQGIYGGSVTTSHRKANENDVLTVTVEGKEYSMSLKDAKSNLDKLTAEEIRLTQVQKELSDLANKKKQLTEKDLHDLESLTKERDELATQIKLQSKYGADAMKEKHDTHPGHVSSLQQVGAFTRVGGNVNQQILAEVKGIHKTIGTSKSANVRRMFDDSGPNFGDIGGMV